MKSLNLNDTVWIVYHDNKVYTGTVNLIDQSSTEGTLVTVLTDVWGFRTVPIEKCSLERPRRKSLSVKRSKK